MSIKEGVSVNAIYSSVLLFLLFIFSVASFYGLSYGYNSYFSALGIGFALACLLEDSKFLSHCASGNNKKADRQKIICLGCRYASLICLVLSLIVFVFLKGV